MLFQQTDRPDPERGTPVATQRRLPHIYPPGKLLFLTWHLYGSLPHHRYPPPHKANAGPAFVWMDRYLDADEAAFSSDSTSAQSQGSPGHACRRNSARCSAGRCCAASNKASTCFSAHPASQCLMHEGPPGPIHA